MAQLGTLPPELFEQQQEATRQQKMAQMLMQQGMQAPQGQIVGGRYVPPSIFQNLANLANVYVGTKLEKEADQRQLDMAKNLRRFQQEEIGQFQEKLAQDPQSAYLFATTAYNPALQSMGVKKLTEGPQWKEITQYNEKTGNTETYRYDANSRNPRDTMQFLGVSKPALSTSDIIKFRDEGIPIPPQYLGGQGQPVGQPMGQPMGQPQTAPMGQPMSQPQGQPTTSAKTNTKPFTLERFGFDPFKTPDLPTNLPAKDVRNIRAEQTKPISGDAAKTVSGATNYIDALTRYRNYMDTLSPQDLLNPQVRAELETKHKQVLLTGKEANNLGVLNGGDERILNAVMPNYSDILITKNTLNKVIDDQMQFGSGAIVAQYRTAEKAVPERLRKYVEIEPMQQTGAKPQGGPADVQTKLKTLGIPYQPKLYDYRVNPDGSVDRKRKIL